MKHEVQKITPFSNGTEFMYWLDENCDRCVKAFRPAKGKDMPDYDTTQKLVNLGRECKIKFAVDVATGLDIPIPEDVARLEGWTPETGWKWNCMLYSDNDDDGWKPAPRKPKDAPDCQLCLPLEINAIALTKEPTKELQPA